MLLHRRCEVARFSLRGERLGPETLHVDPGELPIAGLRLNRESRRVEA